VFSTSRWRCSWFPAVPFYWMVITSVRPMASLPALECDQLQPVLDLETDLEHSSTCEETCCNLAVEHDAHRTCVDRDLAGVRVFAAMRCRG